MAKVIAVDCETTGLFIHKGCQAFTVSACSDDGKIMLWKFWVDPFTRYVDYERNKVEDIRRTISKFDTIVFHNANFDMQVLQSMDISWQWLFDNFDIHDTMVMSHAFKSDNKHGLKENAVLHLNYPDDDEKLLSEITKSARLQAKKLGWRTADKNDLHESIEGTQKEHYRCDYWVPEQLAIELGYPPHHRWRTICDEYAGKDAERTISLYYILSNSLREELYLPGTCPYDLQATLYNKYDEARDLIYPLLDMQAVGIPVKPRALDDAQKLYNHNQKESLDTLKRLSGLPDFNPRSTPQLRKVLFQKYGFEPVKASKKSHAPSCDKDVIDKLLQQATIVNNRIEDKFKFLVALKEYRKETTTLQYINNYEKHSRPTPTRSYRAIQPWFSQTRTGTGRLSCTDPNTTNVGKKDMSNPFADDKDKVRASLFSEILGIDTDHRFSLRNVFGPRIGELWTCIDYDQFQLRIFAVVSESYDLLEGFERGDDIHQLVARIIFNKEDISDVERTAAKAINFGLLFGAGPGKIELLAGVPGLYRKFMDNFPKAKRYLDTQSRLARTYGYVHTVGGYRLYVPHDAPHAASCYVIQGTEAEIVKRAMVRVHTLRNSWTDPTYKLLMMIHDELVFVSRDPKNTIETRYDKKNNPYKVYLGAANDDELSLIMNAMEDSGLELGIPCKVDAKVTNTDWATRYKCEFERVPF